MSSGRKLKNQFRIRIADCGTEQCRGSYSTLKDLNALSLCRRALTQIMDGTVGVASQPLFRYHLACLLLSEMVLETKRGEYKKLKNDIKDAEELRKGWDIK